jgi:hypothetical protein
LQVAHHYESRQTPPLSASLNRLQHKGERVQFSGKCLYGRLYGHYEPVPRETSVWGHPARTGSESQRGAISRLVVTCFVNDA